MKRVFILLWICLSFACSGQAEDGKWLALFNGKDLSNWEMNRAAGSFEVKNGILVAHSADALRSHLFYVGDGDEFVSFKNFELLVVAKGDPESNSGIFIHTDYELRDSKGHLKNGYEVNLNTSVDVTRKTGSLYDVVDLTEQPIDDQQWFETRIRVEGKRVQVWLDGKQVVDYREPKNPKRKESRKGRLFRATGGAVALQAHDSKSVWYFKEIRIKRLKDS